MKDISIRSQLVKSGTGIRQNKEIFGQNKKLVKDDDGN